jgi:hypothetical protein
VNERLRAVLLGLGLGVAPLLLLDLARILGEAVAADGGETSVWWPVACYLGVGAVAAVGVGSGLRDRTIPIVAAVVLLVVVLPTVPADLAARLPAVPLLSAADASQAVVFAVAGAYVYSAVRGGRA